MYIRLELLDNCVVLGQTSSIITFITIYAHTMQISISIQIVSISVEHRFVSRYCFPGLRQRPVQETAEVNSEPGQISEMMHEASLQRRHTLCLQVKTTRVCGKRDENLRRYEEIRSI